MSVIRVLAYSRRQFVGVSLLPGPHLHPLRRMSVKNEIDNSRTTAVSGAEFLFRRLFVHVYTCVSGASTEIVLVTEPTTSFRDLFHFCNKATHRSGSLHMYAMLRNYSGMRIYRCCFVLEIDETRFVAYALDLNYAEWDDIIFRYH